MKHERITTNKPTSTIAAISTASSMAAIGIVRLSGPSSIEIVSKIFKPSKKKNLNKQPTFSMLHGEIHDKNGNRIDEVLVSIMRAPKSYTAEDIAEINCHGGPEVLREVLELLLGLGACLAEPGEFTKRAYLNGRIDLAQAEAVADVIAAKTKLALKAAQGQLGGGLSVVVKNLKNNLINVLAQLQAAIDFSDEDIEADEYEKINKKLENIESKITRLLKTKADGLLLKEGIRTAIIGGPNVGKSSLLNALLEKDRAIVTETEGTTRDLIEETVNINGVPLVLQDTAGIRSAFDEAEKKGIEISKKTLDAADLVLLVLDKTKKIGKVDQELASRSKNKKTIVVLNKEDIKEDTKVADAQSLGLSGYVKVSATNRTGLNALKEEIYNLCVKHKIEPEETIVSSLRHIKALENALTKVDSAKNLLSRNEPEEIIAIEVAGAAKDLSRIIGDISVDEVLDEIFSNFCIGK